MCIQSHINNISLNVTAIKNLQSRGIYSYKLNFSSRVPKNQVEPNPISTVTQTTSTAAVGVTHVTKSTTWKPLGPSNILLVKKQQQSWMHQCSASSSAWPSTSEGSSLLHYSVIPRCAWIPTPSFSSMFRTRARAPTPLATSWCRWVCQGS